MLSYNKVCILLYTERQLLVLSIAAIQCFRDERVAEAEGGCAESVGCSGVDGAVVAVVVTAPFQSQVKHFYHSLACVLLLLRVYTP